jgi:hypothetical protein
LAQYGTSRPSVSQIEASVSQIEVKHVKRSAIIEYLDKD